MISRAVQKLRRADEIDTPRWAFCTAGATIVSGAVAERVQGPTYASYAFVMTSLIYPVVVHWGWSGSGFLGDILDVGVARLFFDNPSVSYAGPAANMQFR